MIGALSAGGRALLLIATGVVGDKGPSGRSAPIVAWIVLGVAAVLVVAYFGVSAYRKRRQR
jgi:hypothetical protein